MSNDSIPVRLHFPVSEDKCSNFFYAANLRLNTKIKLNIPLFWDVTLLLGQLSECVKGNTVVTLC